MQVFISYGDVADQVTALRLQALGAVDVGSWLASIGAGGSKLKGMRSRRCTIDSSCIIALDHLQLVPQLSLLFSPVLVPKAVRKELFKRRVTKDRLQLIFSAYGF